MKVLVVVCHPNPKSFTRAVFDAVCRGLTAGDAEVRCIDLYADGFDPVLVVNEQHRRRDLDKVSDTARQGGTPSLGPTPWCLCTPCGGGGSPPC